MMCWLYHFLALMNTCQAHKLNWCDIKYINLVFQEGQLKECCLYGKYAIQIILSSDMFPC